MRNILAAALIIAGTIFVSAYAICMAVFRAGSLSNMASSEYMLLLIGGIVSIVAGAVLFVLEFRKKQ